MSGTCPPSVSRGSASPGSSRSCCSPHSLARSNSCSSALSRVPMAGSSGGSTRRARGLDPARLGVPRECEPAHGVWRGLQPDGVSLVPAGGPSRGPGPRAGTARAEGSVGPSKSIPGGTVLPRRGGMASAPRPTPATSRRATTTRRERLLARLRGNVRRALRIRSVFYDVLGAINVETRKDIRGNNERLIRSSEP